MAFAALWSSKTVITDKTDYALLRFDISLAIGGSILKTACGRITKKSVLNFPSPSAKAPSYCPSSIDKIAALAISI